MVDRSTPWPAAASVSFRECMERILSARAVTQKAKSRRGAPRGGVSVFAAKACASRSCNREEVSVLGRPGSDLLFQALRLSTIGAGEFNGRVRDGIGFRLPANTTRPAKDGSGNRESGFRRQDAEIRMRFPSKLVDHHPS